MKINPRVISRKVDDQINKVLHPLLQRRNGPLYLTTLLICFAGFPGCHKLNNKSMANKDFDGGDNLGCGNPSNGGGAECTQDVDDGASAARLPCRGTECVVGDRPEPLPRPLCPESAPEVGEACDFPVEEKCGYGENSSAECRNLFECTDGQWSLAKNSILWCEEVGDNEDNFCPADIPKDGSACEYNQTYKYRACNYGNYNCYCQGNWFCLGPPSDTRCPASLPNIGEGCAVQGVECWYGTSLCFGDVAFVFCRSGRWEVGSGPPSGFLC